MKKVLKIPCKLTLEEEYRNEHLARIKAEDYIEEIWGYACALQKEVQKLQSIINKGNYKVEIKQPLSDELKVKAKLKRVLKDREIAIKKMEKKLK